MNFNKEALIGDGFEGFISVKDLWIDKSMIPRQMGVYMVLNMESNVEFINPGVGGFFKGKDPNVDIPQLKEKFVNATVVYIGKAGGSSSKATLFSRIGFEKIPLVPTVTAYGQKILSITASNISKFIGVARTQIDKVIGAE